MPRLLCFGLGFSATALARRLKAEDWHVAGTVREPGKADALAREGIGTFLFDGTAGGDEVRAEIAQATHILASVPASAGGDPVLNVFSEEIAAAKNLEWIGYLSTVGVYGDHGGAWIDEAAACKPVNERSVWRLSAEEDWTALAERRGVPLAILRLAGIYGPGRNQLASLKAGKAKRIVKPGQVFNRIHVEDIAAILEAAIARPHAGARIYNGCDDEPAPPQEVVAFAANLMGVEPPPEVPFDEAQMSAMARSFYADNKRCSNARIRDELGVKLAYPTYREGLTALHEQGAF